MKSTGEIRFPEDDDLASHKHARIEGIGEDPMSFGIRDIGSLNGTWVNGERLSEERKQSEIRYVSRVLHHQLLSFLNAALFFPCCFWCALPISFIYLIIYFDFRNSQTFEEK